MNLNLSSPVHILSLLNRRLKNPQNLYKYRTSIPRGIPFDLMDAMLILLLHEHSPNLPWSRHNDVIVVTPALDGDDHDLSSSVNGSGITGPSKIKKTKKRKRDEDSDLDQGNLQRPSIETVIQILRTDSGSAVKTLPGPSLSVPLKTSKSLGFVANHVKVFDPHSPALYRFIGVLVFIHTRLHTSTLQGGVLAHAVTPQRRSHSRWGIVALTQWWKLHLRPRTLAANHITDDDIPPLPRGKKAAEVLGDFMQYLFRCARSYIDETHPSGSNLWRCIEFVLTHPNGWEGPQQKQIRLATVLGGLIPSTEDGVARVHLLTEGEASLHHCVDNTLASDALSKTPILASDDGEHDDHSPGQGVVVIDAGGGTIDLGAYSMTLSPTLIEEIAAAEYKSTSGFRIRDPSCSRSSSRFASTRFGTSDVIHQMTEIFDSTTKLRFRNPEDPAYIKFGTIHDKDPQHDIRSGYLKLDVAKLFEPSINSIIEAFETQRRAAGTPITVSFAASDWMFAKLQAYFQSLGIGFSRPDNHCNKAIADGAVLYFIDHLVSSRVSRFTYGTECSIQFNPFDVEHHARQKETFRNASGILALPVPRAFSSILTKGTRVSEQQEFSKTFAIRRYSQAACHQVEVGIMSYRGFLPKPDWLDIERSLFSTLCTIRADTSKIAEKLTPKHTAEGSTYYAMKIKVTLLFGLTELKAVIRCEDGGEEIQ
ncbi:hypothetical protein F4604DRAFT_2044473 [Suillus subluteus]|nr:hypothetical protein F4604DRAFT_2044473 [Suillus subluteus]